jgi:hypothetical protein
LAAPGAAGLAAPAAGFGLAGALPAAGFWVFSAICIDSLDFQVLMLKLLK